MEKVVPTSYDYVKSVSPLRQVRTWYRDGQDVSHTGMPGPVVGHETDRHGGQRVAKDVLVVEDESYLCDLIADVLESEGHTARTASNGLEALDLMRQRKPHIVLLDLMMPVMDGWEFMDALRENPQWDGVPIVIISAIYDAKRTQRETGARAVITKPFDIDQITEIVRLYAI